MTWLREFHSQSASRRVDSASEVMT